MKRLIPSTLLLLLVLSVPSYGWSDTGHMAVAYVAYNNLSPAVRDRVDLLVRLNPKYEQWKKMIPADTAPGVRNTLLFMIAATWPDQIKGDKEYVADGPGAGNIPPSDGTADRNIGYEDRAMHKYWHFIDMPFSTDGTPTKPPPAPNALTQITAFRKVLSSNSPDALKSYDLVWLMHMVGDVHQPLHCAARFAKATPKGDDGGNSVTVCDPQCGTRLHAFWDNLLGTSSDPVNAYKVAMRLPRADPVLAAKADASEWIKEGFQLASEGLVYKSPIGPGVGPYSLDATYRKLATQIAQQRVALAGARLARILNADLAAPQKSIKRKK